MRYKLICIDIDGTLLDDDKKLHPEVKKCLNSASERGVQIALASGRMPAGVELIEKELGIECIKICNAGTYILKGGACMNTSYLSNNDMRDIYHRYARKKGIPLWIFSGKDWYITAEDKFTKREITIIPYQPQVVDLEQLADRWDKEGRQPNKLLVAAEPKLISEIYQDMEERGYQEISMARSADIFLEIFPKGVDKGTALCSICESLGISQEETIAIGDQELDIPMIEAAGFGIAMGNAIEALKEKADFVTKSNNEAGVAYALEKYLN